MNRITFLFVLFFLLQNTFNLKAQEFHNLSETMFPNQEKILQQSDEISDPILCFHYDKIVGELSTQLDGDYLLETLKREIWDQTSSSWTNDSLYDYSYNDMDLVDTIISRKWEDGYHWTYKLRSTYSYNTNGKIILKRFAEMFYGNWQDYTRLQYTYTGSNQNLSRIDVYSFSSNNWALTGYHVYSWNSNNCLSNVISYSLSTIFPWTYVPYWQDSLYYNLSNQLVIKTGFDYVGCDWFNDINDLYFYDQNGNNNERIRQEWNSTGGSWVNDYRYLYEYDINNVLLSIVYQDWQQDSLNWKNVWRETYTYTPQNKLAIMFKETWSTETGWNNYVQRIFFYDLNDNWTEKITYLWDGSNWNNYYRHLATWLVPVSVWETLPYLESYYLSNNYPNPFNPSTKIKFEIPDQGFVSLKVYDVLGNEIVTLVNEQKPAGEYEVYFEGKGLPSGIYFYTLKAGNYIETRKMILIK
jgi:hypothetical protein